MPVYRNLVGVVKRTKAKLSFNPGTHQLNVGAKKLKPVLDVTTVLFLNKEEARLVTRIEEEDDLKQLLRAMVKLGPQVAVITDGSKGSFVFDRTSYYRLPVFPAPVIERTGAGDSFGSAFTAALCYGKDVREAMRWGTADAAGVIQKIGPQDGLLHLSALKATLRRHSRFQARTF